MRPELKTIAVKPLEWGSTSYGTPEVVSIAGVHRVNRAVNGGYSVVIGGLWGRVLSAPDGRANFATENEARAAAQADFDARILSAATLHPDLIAYVERLESAAKEALACGLPPDVYEKLASALSGGTE